MPNVKQSITNTKSEGSLIQKASGTERSEISQMIDLVEGKNIEQIFSEIAERKNKSKVDFIAPEIITDLEKISNPSFDLKRLLLMVKELNANYRNGNIISVLLIGRSILNHVPPIFGQQTFKAVCSNSPRSLQGIFDFLENNFRKEADLHTHMVIGNIESLPTMRQVEPFMANFEFLFQAIKAKLK